MKSLHKIYPKRGCDNKMKRSKFVLVLFLAPAVLSYLLVFIYPVVRTFVMSFFKVVGVTDPISRWAFNGFDNYITVLNSSFVQQSFTNIFNIWLYGGISVMFLALLFAVILTSGIRLKRFFRASIYLPNVISAVAMATMWIQYVFHQRFGLLNEVFTVLGLTELAAIPWTGPRMLFWSMLIAYSFGMVGYHMLIFMAGIDKIPLELFEAAKIDGANVFGRFSFITLPLLKGVFKTNIVLWTVSTAGFFIWSQMFSPLIPAAQTVTPMIYVFQMLFGADLAALDIRDSGAGAAVAVMLTVLIVVVFLLVNMVMKKDDVEY